ncbi:MAG: hypothetical protein KAX11_01365, partial [Candidatus Aminicenantes bacterium]|nr:hypothetical protein [Candidatus Aminicenantes bacterium]
MPSDNKVHKDDIHKFISKGRKQGYLLYDEIDKTFQKRGYSSAKFDAFLSSLEDYGIKIRERRRSSTPKRRKSDLVSIEGLERTTDPVKLYLREMGNISLLTREGEVTIAKEIERGEISIIKALSKTRLVLYNVLEIEDRIHEDPDIIQEMFELSDDDIADGKLEDISEQILDKIRKIRDMSNKLDKIPKTKKFKLTRGRIIVQMSRAIRNLGIRPSHRENVIETLRDKLIIVNDLEELKEELNASLKHAISRKSKRKESYLKKEIREVNKNLRTLQKEIGLDSQTLRKTIRAITT